MTTEAGGVLTAEQAAFLREHRLGVLGTGRRDGSPALATVLYDFDGRDVVASMLATSAKWRNALRQPRVALAVLDGRAQLVVYGVAVAEERGAGRREAMRRIFAKQRGGEERAAQPDAALDAALDGEGRVVLRITPQRALSS
jgi:PPOX class probable F420-dependent enzyme